MFDISKSVGVQVCVFTFASRTQGRRFDYCYIGTIRKGGAKDSFEKQTKSGRTTELQEGRLQAAREKVPCQTQKFQILVS